MNVHQAMKTARYWVILASGCFCAPLLANGNQYQVELIVFSQNFPNTEVFNQIGSKIVWPSNLYEAADYTKAEMLTLTDSYQALSGNAAYLPLLHGAWVQKLASDATEATSAHIQSPDGRVNGYVQVLGGNVLQLKTDLEYIPGADVTSGNALIYRMNDSRQIKLDELNYFDHPKFGMIVKVSALK